MNRHAIPPRALAVAIAIAVTSALLTAAVAVRPDGRVHLTVLDTAGGSAVLIRDGSGETVLVGGGGDPQHLLVALGRQLSPLQRDIDTVVVASGGHGAVAGLDKLAEHYSVKTAAVALPAPPPTAASMLTQLGDHGAREVAIDHSALPAGEFILLPLRPPDAAVAAVLVIAPGVRALLLGDMSIAAQEELASVSAFAIDAELVVAPATGVAATLLNAVRPRHIAVSTAGSRDRTVWPGADVRLTGFDGDLGYLSGAAGFEPT